MIIQNKDDRFSIDKCMQFILENFKDDLKEVDELLGKSQLRSILTLNEIEDKKEKIKQLIKDSFILGDKGFLEQSHQQIVKGLMITDYYFNKEEDIWIECLNGLARILNLEGEYDSSIQVCELALVQLEQNNGIEKKIFFDCLYWKGENLYRKGQYEQSNFIAEKVLEFYQKQTGEESLETANALNLLGYNFKNLNQIDKALDFYEKGLKIRMKYLESNALEVSNSLCNIGGIYSIKKQYQKAREFYLQTLSIQREWYKENTINNYLACSIQNLAIVEYYLKNIHDAELLFIEALHITTQLFGKQHINTAFVQCNLGQLYFEQKQFNLAEPLISQAYETRKQQFKENHQKTLTTKQLLDKCRSNIKN